MPSGWGDSVEKEKNSEENSAGAAPRQTYVPPHLRNRPDAPAAAAAPAAAVNSYPNSGRGGRGSAWGSSVANSSSGNNHSSSNGSFWSASGGSWGGSGGRRSKEADPFAAEEEAVQENSGINFDAYDDIPVQATGENVPNAVTAFDEIDFGNALNDNIRRCNFVKPTPVQRYAIPIALAGRDLMACAQTGSGKTLAFCFPIIAGVLQSPPGGRPQRGSRQAFPLALILSPTRELATQIYEQARKFAWNTGVRVTVAYGGTPIYQQLRELEMGVDILVATPGRLNDIMDRGKVRLSACRYLAIDEADRMLDMGFEPQIRKIVEQSDLPPPGLRQTMLFSATFPKEIQRLASDFLSNYIFLAVGRVGSSTDLIQQKVEYVRDHEKLSLLIDIIHAQAEVTATKQPPLMLVFVETKRGADQLEDVLLRAGFNATTIHGDRTQQERESALRSFKKGVTPILVATDVAARGLDIPLVAHVINYDLPNEITDYTHRIGRTGRAGKTGIATAFFTDKDTPIARDLAELMQESHQEVPGWLHNYAARSGFGGKGRSRGSRGAPKDYRRSGGGGSGGGGGRRGGGGYHDSYGGGSGFGGGFSGGNYGRGDSSAWGD